MGVTGQPGSWSCRPSEGLKALSIEPGKRGAPRWRVSIGLAWVRPQPFCSLRPGAEATTREPGTGSSCVLSKKKRQGR